MEGEPLRWEVQVVGEPIPVVTWYRQEERIASCPEVQLIDVRNDVCIFSKNLLNK